MAVGTEIKDNLLTIAQNEQQVFDAGVQQEYERFWEGMQRVTKERSAYSFGGRGWNNANFRPPFPIVFYENAKFVLRNTRIDGDITELAEIDFSKCTNMEYAFSGNHWLTAIGVIDASSVTNENGAYYFACDNRYLRRVELFISTPTISWDGIFANCPELEELRVEGIIGSNRVNLGLSRYLSRESIESVINHLSTSVTTITLSADAVENAFGGLGDFDDWVSSVRPKLSVSLI